MKTKRNLYIASVIIVILIAVTLGYSLLMSKAPKSYVIDNNGTPATKNTQTGEITPGVTTFSLAEVATHTDAKSCYTIINGGVYDLTAFVSKHEGGSDAILSLCGKDGTAAFTQQHKGAAKIMRVLARFKIGEHS